MSVGVLVLIEAGHDAALLVFADAFFEKIGFSLQGDEFHPVKRVCFLKEFRVSEGDEQPIGHEFDVLGHETRVHADEVAFKCVTYEFALNLHSPAHYVNNNIVGQFVFKHRVHKASELGVKAFISRDELVREGESGHKASFFKPIYGAKTTAKKDALDACKGAEAFREAVLGVHPSDGPLGFLFDGRDRVDGLEKVRFLHGILHIRVNKEGVGLRVNIFHGLLKAVKGPRFRDLHLCVEVER